MPSMIVLELNELCPPLLDRFIAAGDLPNLARLRTESMVCVTDAGEPQGRLNPWIQWVTAHTGVGFDEHGVFKLGEGANLTIPTIADAVGDAGGSVWLCGPMNVVPTKPVHGRWLPDPWNPDDSLVPADMAPFAGFVRANVQEHSNAAHRLSPRAYISFLTFMARHGLSFATVRATAAQLVGERVGRRARWRRAALLDRFQWDVFRHVLRGERPTLATYFSNTVAHNQHLFWRYMDPEPFELKPTDAERATYGDAIRSAYREADRLVGDALVLAGAETTLVLCTALSQQPYLLKEAEGGKRFYRPHDIADFVRQLGVVGVDRVAPVMSEQFHLFFRDEPAASVAEVALRDATVGDDPAFTVRRVGTDLLTGFSPGHDLPADAVIDVPATGARVPVHAALYRSETAKSGYHHPEGALWIRSRGLPATVVDESVPLLAVAPTLLTLLGVAVPSTMTTPAIERVTHLAGR
jgi:hypothetical protein